MVGYIRTLKITLTICGLLFITASVIYTTNLIFFSPLSGLISAIFDWLALLPGTPPARDLSAASHAAFLASRSSGENRWKEPSGPKLSWISSRFTLQHGLGHNEAIPVNTGLLLSKGTASSMGPSNAIPYFYRARGSFDADDITVTTLITSNRFKVFARLVERYRGPISVTVHISDIAEHVPEVLESLREMYTSSQLMMTFVDVHLVVDAFDRQFNTWRNIARLFARTDFVMMLDIDFLPCTDFRSVIKRSSTIFDKLHNGRAALVIPAFEYVDFHEGSNYAAFPTKKRDLLHLVQKQRIGMFHAFWGPGHNATDYKRFYNSSPGEVYKVMKYQSAYEPYIIFRKDGPPWCDERFVGYGGNKAACLFEMYLAGVSYYVLADHFIIHQNHLYEDTVRIPERRYNRKLYADFKEETCLRYLKRYHDRGLLGSSLAANALTECRKIKTLTRSAAKVIN
ncbi:glycosyltransferase family 49 protein [Hebeloma cylindrosporum]|uniref:Glycosyltransferase family 49 protein n=1 Tax=Hebeloma cylindrosporum TaxID=76867 RepID=A0A0C3BU93_HEBCY|nr:glycosyltransferase family 49 protein [Hebeloma cylindrosporum h7]